MQQELANQTDPLDASLEKVLPGVHQWHRINSGELSKLQDLLKESVGDLNMKYDVIHSTILASREETNRQLSAAFLQLSNYFLQHGNSVPGDGIRRLPDSHQVVQVQVGATETFTQETGTANENDGDANDPADLHALFWMVPKHLVLLDLIHEWFGVGDYYDCYGGVDGRNKTFKTRWKKKCHINAMHYSRTERTVKAVEEYALRKHMNKFDAAVQLQDVYEINCKQSVTKFVLWAQEEGLITKSKSRGSRKKHMDADDD